MNTEGQDLRICVVKSLRYAVGEVQVQVEVHDPRFGEGCCRFLEREEPKNDVGDVAEP